MHEQRALDTSLTAQKYQFGTQFGQQRDGRVADHIGGSARGLSTVTRSQFVIGMKGRVRLCEGSGPGPLAETHEQASGV